MRRIILASMILVPFIPFILSLGTGYYYFTTSIGDSTISSMKRIVEDHRQMIESFLDERKRDLDFILQAYTFRDLSQPEELKKVLDHLQRGSDAFVDLGIFNAAGLHVAYHGPFKLAGKLYRDAYWFKEVMKHDYYIKEAVEKLKESFSAKVSTSRIMETGHRSLLVFDESGKVEGILSIIDLLSAIMPAYLSAPKPSMADSMVYSPMFWTGMFTREVRQLASTKIKDIMSPAPLTINAGANLMEAAHMMTHHMARRLAVEKGGEVVGVIREQDLFFEIEKILGA